MYGGVALPLMDRTVFTEVTTLAPL